jgi:aminopeptidase N
VPGLVGAPRTDLILLNDDDLGYALVRFDPRSLRTVLASLGEIADPVARAVCWNALADMVAQAELPVPAFTRALAAGVRREPSAAGVQAILALAQPVVERLAAPAAAADAKRELADLAAGLLASAEPDGDLQLLWAQLLSWTAMSPSQLDLVAGLMAGTAPVPGLEAGAELRWALLRRLCARGRAGDDEIDAELALDPTEAGHRNATACRAAIPSAVHKKAAWTLLSGGTLGPASVRLTARAFMLPEHSALLAGYAGEYVPALAEIWDERGGHLKALLGDLLFPYPVISPGLLSSLAAFAAARPADLALARLAAELGDFGQRALRSRALA